MLALDLFESDFKTNDLTLIDALRDFLPLAVKTLELPGIPKISLEKSIEKSNVPTFGRFTNDDDHVYVHISNRNPNDILRTLAHELVHFKQRTEHELGAGSWHTGSPAENQAHELAGVIMREFNSQFPQYLRMKPVILPGGNGAKELDEAWSKKYKKSINCSNPKGFSQKAHCAGRRARKAGRKTKSSSVSESTEPRLYTGEELDIMVHHLSRQLGMSAAEVRRQYVEPMLKDGRIKLVQTKVQENFADGKNPGRKGLAKRSGVNCKQSVSKLRSIAKHSTGEKSRMAHWCANMKSGRSK